MNGYSFVYKPKIGDSIICPGCEEKVKLDWADGWRNDAGFTCYPVNTTHSQHIFTSQMQR